MKIKKILLTLILFTSLLIVGCSFVGDSKYKVTFYSQGKVVSSERYSKGETINIPEDPVSEGEYFLGWDVNNDGKPDEITTCENNMNIRAIFGQVQKYVVIFMNGDVEISRKTYFGGEMPQIPADPVREGYIFVGWDANNDDEVDGVKVVTENAIYGAVFRDNAQNYTIDFIFDDKVIESFECKLGDTVNVPDLIPSKAKSDKYTYTFKGWDVNGDDDPEVFPFTVKGNHHFIAIFTETINQYTYRLYDGITLISTKTVDYGTKIEYDGPIYKTILGKYYYLIGWDKTGDDKPDDETVTRDTDYKAVYADKQIVLMHYEGQLFVKYVKQGDAFELYQPELPSSRKCVWYVDSEYQTQYVHQAMIKGNLDLYGRSEQSYEIDCSVLQTEKKDEVSSESELIALFNYLVFSHEYNHVVKLNYKVTNEKFAELLCENCKIDAAYQLGTSYNSFRKELTLNIQYKTVNTTSIKSLYEENEIPYYTQYKSLNLHKVTPTRTDDFTLFIDSVENSFNVSTSEQLYYVLEHGYRPIISEDNTELLALYNKMRNVLKDNINDGMSDYEKVLIIYEWLIMNVTYDRVALQLSNDPNVSIYHSFYLEGVFNENLAVCDGISKALVCLCNMEGIPAIRVTGTGKENHAWNKVCVNNNWYVVDATSGGTIINNTFEILTHRFLFITDEDYASFYQEDGRYYPEFHALGIFNYYDNFTYDYLNHSYKFYCEEKSDLVRILKWFKASDETNITVDAMIGFEYDSINNLMSSVMGEAHYTTSLNYSVDNDKIIFIK